MKPVRTWILIADGGRARILQNDGPGKGIEPVEGSDYHTSHEPDRDIQADRPGRTHDSAGQSRHSMEAPTSPHRAAKSDFARLLAGELDRKLAEGAFERLLIVAPPQALGDLRQHLSGQLKAALVGEVHKDLTHVPNGALTSHLADFLAI